MTVAVKVENLSKKYRINHVVGNQPRSIREAVGQKLGSLLPFGRQSAHGLDATGATKSVEDFYALRDVSFEIKEGERIAIIGGNGAGKSTLLKILSRITEPSSGTVAIRGKVSSLLEVGTGFHPELTGRENIFLNGAILGMPRAEILRKFDEIVDFSGVEKFIDTPVKFYSSGMYVRLAFSVSAWLDPDILIVDEVLSVGDQAFQKRCMERMKELTSSGRTVLFVSHSMAAVKSMCEKALYLKKGEVVAFSAVDDVAVSYTRTISEEAGESAWHKPTFSLPDPEIDVQIDCADYIECIGGMVADQNGAPTAHLDIDKPFSIVLRYRIKRAVPYRVVPNFHFYDEAGGRVFISFPETPAMSEVGDYEVVCHIDPFQFNNGRFSVMPALSSYEMENPLHFALFNALRFEVHEPNNSDPRRHGWGGGLPGVSRPRLKWDCTRL
ncbi:ABC transporter ATP-binding protein [Cupriavidus plantarum]|uniref:ABC transporter ATP-binding protein n=1 Tax=Cupriavidus plantarum TaxID=942865 RepID=UPI00339D4966